MKKDNWLKKTVRGIEHIIEYIGYGLLIAWVVGIGAGAVFYIFVYPYLVFFLNWFNGAFTYFYSDGTYITDTNPFMVLAFIVQAFIVMVSVFIGLLALHDYAHTLNGKQSQEVE